MQNISNENVLFIRYEAYRETTSGLKTYKILVGPTIDKLQECDSRFYIRTLNLNYINSNRDLRSFIRKEKSNLLEKARNARNQIEISKRQESLESIKLTLNKAKDEVSQLSFISRATEQLNSELSSLSVSNEELKVNFDTGASDVMQ